MPWSSRRPDDAPSHNAPALPPESDAQRLLEELRIHQVELQLQSDALQASQQEALAQAERYRHLLRAAPVPLCQLDERGAIRAPNDALCQLLGQPAHTLQDQLLYRLGRDELQRVRALQAVQQSTHQKSHEVRGVWLRGAEAPLLVDLHFSEVPAPQGGQHRWLVALVDQTARHREHEALQEANEALHKALAVNQELALLADRSPNAVMICDADQRIRWVNPSFIQATGYSLQEARGMRPDDLLGPGQDDATVRLMQQRVMRGEAVDRIRVPRQTRLGTQYWAEVSVLPVHNEAGLISRHIVIERDISDRLQAESEREALMKAEANHAVKTEFLSRMSHNMRTPLNAVMGFAHLLLQGPEAVPLPGQRKKLEIIHQAGQQLLGLVNQALQLAQLEHALEDYAPEAINLQPLASDCATLMAAQAHAQGLQIVCEVPIIYAMGDAQRVREILDNLLSNAVKYSMRPGVIEVRGQLDPVTHLVQLTVRDPGVGIAPQDQARIFQPFTRLDETAGMAPGHGIGLAICKRLAELMLGDLTVHSTVGQGSTFTLTLPAADHLMAHPTPMTTGDTDEPPLELPAMRLLCVEDNAMNRVLIEAVFSTQPQVQVAMACTLNEGLQCVRGAPPDVVLLDINLPDGHGLTLAHEVAQWPAERRPLVIALSADALPESIAVATDTGVDHYLVKPLQINRLLNILHAHFRV
jgi:PAS domain S-box-containing protein